MASGDPVVQIISLLPPRTAFATPDTRLGGSTPAEDLFCLDFDADADEHHDFLCVLRGYQGSGLTFNAQWAASSATSGNIRLGIAIRRLDTAEDVDTAHTYDFNEVTVAAPGVNGRPAYSTITFANGAEMDNWVDGELAIVRVRRRGTDATNDTMTGDAELWALQGRET